MRADPSRTRRIPTLARLPRVSVEQAAYEKLKGRTMSPRLCAPDFPLAAHEGVFSPPKPAALLQFQGKLLEERRVVNLQQSVCLAQRLSLHENPLDRVATSCYPLKSRGIEHVEAVVKKGGVHHEEPTTQLVSQWVVLELAVSQPPAGVRLAAARASIYFEEI